MSNILENRKAYCKDVDYIEGIDLLVEGRATEENESMMMYPSDSRHRLTK
jgi:hypothetical protein